MLISCTLPFYFQDEENLQNLYDESPVLNSDRIQQLKNLLAEYWEAQEQGDFQ